MIEICIVFTAYVLVSGAIIVVMYRLAQDERRELEDRIMALSKPETVPVYKAIRDKEAAEITYVDEETRRSTRVPLEDDE